MWGIVLLWLYLFQPKVSDYLLYSLLLEMRYLIGQIILFHEHFIALKQFAFPKLFLELRKTIKDPAHQVLFDQ